METCDTVHLAPDPEMSQAFLAPHAQDSPMSFHTRSCLQVKQSQWQDVVKNCDKVLEADADNIKALYRRAQAYLNTQVGRTGGSMEAGHGQYAYRHQRRRRTGEP